MTITAKVIRRTQWNGTEAITWHCHYPKYIHAQVLTHRLCERNSRSNRACPMHVTMRMVKDDPVMPLEYRRATKGMQPGELLPDDAAHECERLIRLHRRYTLKMVSKLNDMKLAKEVSNRYLEPHQHIDTLITIRRPTPIWTGGMMVLVDPLKGFLKLRDHGDAQSEIRILAQEIARSHQKADVVASKHHTPYVAPDHPDRWLLSAARCARISYAPFNYEKADEAKDLELVHRLLDSGHLSPFGHPEIFHGQEGYFIPCRQWSLGCKDKDEEFYAWKGL